MRRRARVLVVGVALSSGLGLARAQDAKPAELPPVDRAPGDAAPVTSGTGAPPAAATPSKGDPFALDELTVLGTLPRNAASSDVVRARDFELRPIRTPGDLLRLVPGLQTMQHQGGGKADQILIRGFDADHGTDLAIFVDGVPVNLRTHSHGQGWADLHWVIPEFIQEVEVRKGPYYADVGDFATAGSVRLVTRDSLESDQHVMAKAELGSFNTTRLVLGVSPVKNDDARTLVGAELYYTDGPTDSPQRYRRGNFFAKGAINLTPDVEVSAWASGMYGEWNASGEIPLRAVRNNTIRRFGAIDDSEGGLAERSNAHLQLRWTPSKNDLVQLRAWGGQERLRLYSNFTFFLDEPDRGDGLEQIDQRWMGGGDLRYEHVHRFGTVSTKLTVGVDERSDLIDVKLARQQRRRRFENTNSVHVVETSLAPYTEVEVAPVKGLRLLGGMRQDFFWYQVQDDHDATIGIAGNDADSAPQPKAGIVLGPFKSDSPVSSTELYFNFGQGFHSNDARAVVQTNIETLPRAQGYEVGFRTYAFERLDVAADFFLLDLESELVFSGDGGVPEPSGRTRRMGGELEARLRVIDEWLWVESDVSYTEGRFTRTNQPIPLAPRLLVRAGVTLKTPVGFQASFEARHLGKRPVDDDGLVDAPAQTVCNLVLRYIPVDFENVEIFCRIENLFDVRWREAQHYQGSQLPGEGQPVADFHFTPGAPFSIFGGVTVKF